MECEPEWNPAFYVISHLFKVQITFKHFEGHTNPTIGHRLATFGSRVSGCQGVRNLIRCDSPSNSVWLTRWGINSCSGSLTCSWFLKTILKLLLGTWLCAGCCPEAQPIDQGGARGQRGRGSPEAKGLLRSSWFNKDCYCPCAGVVRGRRWDCVSKPTLSGFSGGEGVRLVAGIAHLAGRRATSQGFWEMP